MIRFVRSARACAGLVVVVALAAGLAGCAKKSPEERAAAAQEYLNLGNKAFSTKKTFRIQSI